MTIKQRIFRTNSLMVLFSLVILLLIGGSMISIFKDRFLGWYSDNSKISEKYVDAYQKIENMDFSAGDWEQYAKAVQPYDFHLIVRDENGKSFKTGGKQFSVLFPAGCSIFISFSQTFLRHIFAQKIISLIDLLCSKIIGSGRKCFRVRMYPVHQLSVFLFDIRKSCSRGDSQDFVRHCFCHKSSIS